MLLHASEHTTIMTREHTFIHFGSATSPI